MRKIVSIVLVALALTACSDSKKASAPDPTNDKVIADNALLRVSELPGFTEDPSDFASSSPASAGASSSAPSEEDPVLQCIQQATGTDFSHLSSDRTARSKRTFSGGTGSDKTTISASIELYRSASPLDAAIEAMRQPTVSACLKTAMQNSFGVQEIDVPDVTITPSPLPGVGDGGTTLVLKGTLSTVSFSTPFVSEIDFVRVGRSSLSVSITKFSGDTVDHDLAVRGIKTMVGRLKL